MTKDGLVFEVAGIVSVLVSVTGSAKRLYLGTAGSLYPNSCFSGPAGFSDLNPLTEAGRKTQWRLYQDWSGKRPLKRFRTDSCTPCLKI